MQEGMCRRGYPHGPERSYDEDGQLISEKWHDGEWFDERGVDIVRDENER
jgi:hypothetical protein